MEAGRADAHAADRSEYSGSDPWRDGDAGADGGTLGKQLTTETIFVLRTVGLFFLIKPSLLMPSERAANLHPTK
jgi:hypothetical protein